jgi:hypothetical protein
MADESTSSLKRLTHMESRFHFSFNALMVSFFGSLLASGLGVKW